MRALVADGVGGLALSDVADPTPGPSECVVRTEAASINYGEARYVRGGASRGFRPGWDVAGVVAVAAADGSGPAVGDRVAAYVPSSGWAELVGVPTDHVARIPDGVLVTDAAALPCAGLTALRALSYVGFSLGRRVLVTGAAGGVGRIAVQLAQRAGARVTAIVGRPERAEALASLSGVAVSIGQPPATERFDLILESVAGDSLAHALRAVAPGGTVVAYGRSSNEPSQIGSDWIGGHAGARLVALYLVDELERHQSWASDLQRLLDLVADAALDPGVSLVVAWEKAEQAIDRLLSRELAGKAVMTIG